MPNAIYLTDIHVNKYSQFSENRDRLKDCLKVIKDAFAYAKAYESDTIMFGGDLGDLPKWIYIEVIDDIMLCFDKMFKKYPEITWYAVSGNHDQNKKNFIDNPAKTLLNVFATAFPGRFILIDNNMQVFEGYTVAAIPYYEYAEHYSQALDQMCERVLLMKEDWPNNKVTLMIHQTPECAATKHYKAHTNPADPRYKLFDMVLDGHIHKKELINPKFLVGGNTHHRDLGDIGDEKGMWVMDLLAPSETLEFISRKGRYPEFIRMKPEDVTDEIRNSHFVVPEITSKEIVLEGSADTELFGAGVDPKQLLENFWAETEGRDSRLLAVGLSLFD